ncbi:MAG: trypsin-like serine protease [Myxococcales bacterium]|nr:trypsin-like serine protease [Myxococcales bacterium]MDH3483178.1 trypsin-like serine protease [Myxococcales bacterium]
MKSRIIEAIVACGFLAGCGDVASDAPHFSDEVEWVVGIDFATGHMCSGSILSEHWILTAGHCVERAISLSSDADGDRLVIRQQATGEPSVIYEGTAELILHPDYKGLGHISHRWHDIGLVALLDEALDARHRARLSGTVRTFEALYFEEANLFALGFGRTPDPDTGRCTEELGPKKRYDGFVLRSFDGPIFGNAFSVRLDGRTDALCYGDSGAPLMFEAQDVPHAFAVYSGPTRDKATFHGTLIGPNIAWFESVSSETPVPLECAEMAKDGWECFE